MQLDNEKDAGDGKDVDYEKEVDDGKRSTPKMRRSAEHREIK